VLTCGPVITERVVSVANRYHVVSRSGACMGFSLCSPASVTRTGDLAAVMRTMGHRDVKTAMHYQHPELEIVRAALDYDAHADSIEARS